MTTIEIEIAMMRFFGVRQNLIVPNVSWGIYADNKFLHECDLLILSPSSYATEVEIKISKKDILQDKKKYHKHRHNLIARFYFAVPEELKDFALENIPDRTGVFVVSNNKVKKVKECIRNTNAKKWTDAQRLKLAHLGCMRILGLKQKLFKIGE